MPEAHFVGELAHAYGFGPHAIYVRWRIVSGDGSFRHMAGQEEGRTWIAHPHPSDQGGGVVLDTLQAAAAALDPKGRAAGATLPNLALFNTPLKLHYAFAAMRGWPQVLVQVFQVDSLSRVDLVGYGSVYLPAQPGFHGIDIPCFRPRGSAMQALAGRFLGGHPQYIDPDVVLSGHNRFNHPTVSTGTIHVDISVALRGLDLFGVDTAPPPIEPTLCTGCFGNGGSGDKGRASSKKTV